MKTILCFGDSNTWGFRPDGTGRFEWEARWPGILQRELSGYARIIEEGLNARTTVFDDPVGRGVRLPKRLASLATLVRNASTDRFGYHLSRGE